MKLWPCVVVLSLSTLSCATLFKGTVSETTLLSNPTGAKVYINNNYVGTTPVSLELRSKDDYVIRFELDGYPSKSRMLQGDVQGGYIVLDILAGFIPVIIDAVTGAWYDLPPVYSVALSSDADTTAVTPPPGVRIITPATK